MKLYKLIILLRFHQIFKWICFSFAGANFLYEEGANSIE